jgi:hypothetical protein
MLDAMTLEVLKDGGLIHSRGVSAKSPYANKVYLTYSFILQTLDLDTWEVADVKSGDTPLNVGGSAIGWDWVQLNDPDFPGLTLVAWSGNQAGKFFKYNPTTGNLKVVNLEIPKTVSTLHTLAFGPDGKLYASAYLGTYPGAVIFEYDTAKAWKSSGTGRTVVQKIQLKTTYEQDRPYAMLGVPELGRIFIGTVPDYGKRGGALTVYDPATGAFQVHRDIVAGHSIASLAYKDGVVYGGSSYRGGLVIRRQGMSFTRNWSSRMRSAWCAMPTWRSASSTARSTAPSQGDSSRSTGRPGR